MNRTVEETRVPVEQNTGVDEEMRDMRQVRETERPQQPEAAERLAPLFAADAAQSFRARWDSVQIGFVDDPQQAVRQADELVGQVMNSLSETFANERTMLDAQMSQGDKSSTENLRVALRRYRSFFERLLSL